MYEKSRERVCARQKEKMEGEGREGKKKSSESKETERAK